MRDFYFTDDLAESIRKMLLALVFLAFLAICVEEQRIERE
jgi:hypothetical protein